ncbi:hypothetical protein GW17_00047538, partial [Ensete ventricosum]
YMFGDGTSGHMTLEEMYALERHLEIWMEHIRTMKISVNVKYAKISDKLDTGLQMQIMFQEIQSLKNKVFLF